MDEKNIEIQILRRKNAELKKHIAKVEAERDAAVHDLRFGRCSVCRNPGSDKCGMCAVLGDQFEWRGEREC